MIRLKHWVIVAVFLGMASPAFAQGSTDLQWPECEWRPGVIPADQAIRGCTSVINGTEGTMVAPASAYNIRGEAHRYEGDYGPAIDDFTSALRLRPNFPEALRHRALAQLSQRRFAEALADCNAALSLNPNDDDALYARGLVFFSSGDYTSAIANFTSVLERNPHASSALFVRGEAFDALHDHEHAIADLTAFINLGPRLPNYALALCDRGRIYALQGDRSRAMADFEASTKASAGTSCAYGERAKIYEKEGDYQSALRDMDTAIANNPGMTDFFIQRARLKDQLSDPDGAAADRAHAEELKAGNRE
jgi:tetratricopeptide (TPR) repeat protein